MNATETVRIHRDDLALALKLLLFKQEKNEEALGYDLKSAFRIQLETILRGIQNCNHVEVIDP